MTVKRVTFVQELLAFMGLGGRVHLAWISSAEAQKFARVVTDFTEQVRALGPNPLPALLRSASIGSPSEKPPARIDDACRECASALTAGQ
jgi:Methyl-viologen-reducing hydrogenase, delta subunit